MQGVLNREVPLYVDARMYTVTALGWGLCVGCSIYSMKPVMSLWTALYWWSQNSAGIGHGSRQFQGFTEALAFPIHKGCLRFGMYPLLTIPYHGFGYFDLRDLLHEELWPLISCNLIGQNSFSMVYIYHQYNTISLSFAEYPTTGSGKWHNNVNTYCTYSSLMTSPLQICVCENTLLQWMDLRLSCSFTVPYLNLQVTSGQ